MKKLLARLPFQPILNIICPSNGIAASEGAATLTSDCIVSGDIVLSGTASVTMIGALLTVAGNVVLKDQVQLTIINGGLKFPPTTTLLIRLRRATIPSCP